MRGPPLNRHVGLLADRDSLVPDLVDVGAGVLDRVTLLKAARSISQDAEPSMRSSVGPHQHATRHNTACSRRRTG